MASSELQNTRIRSGDYAVAKAETQRLPIKIVDVMSAWRHLWESAPQKKRDEAIRRVATASVPSPVLPEPSAA